MMHVCKQKRSSMLIAALISICGTFLLTGCGSGGSLVKNAQLRAYQVDGDAYVGMTIYTDMGGLQLPSLELPIMDPNHPENVYGKVSMKPILVGDYAGKSELSVDINASQIINAPGLTDCLLPNGSQIPLGGLGSSPMYCIPMGAKGGKIYFALDEGVAALGIAFPIEQFDQVGRYVGGLNFFPQFKFGEILGVAGVFTSVDANKSGIAFFLDLSSLFNKNDGQLLAATAASGDLAYIADIATSSTNKITTNSVSTNKNKENTMWYRLWKISNKGGTAKVLH